MSEYTTVSISRETHEKLKKLCDLEPLGPAEAKRTLRGEVKFLVENRLMELGEKERSKALGFD